jgi:serine/threonine-protein kinase
MNCLRSAELGNMIPRSEVNRVVRVFCNRVLCVSFLSNSRNERGVPVAGTQQSWPGGGRVDDYQILEVVGAGGMGVVYKARDLKLERIVALKFLPQEAAVGEKEKARFRAEAVAASGLDHTNIGVIHGLEQTPDGRLYIVMAFYEGATLAQKIHDGPVPTFDAVDLAAQMAAGLAEAHAHGIVHRDIKPSNLILTKQKVLKVVDFGLSLVMSAETYSQSMGIAGTVAYMSPEQANGAVVDHRTDIWSAGVVLAEMLTGEHPFQRNSLPSVMAAIVQDPPAQLEGVPPRLQRIVLRALAKDPENRYQNSTEMLADLRAVKSEGDATTLGVSSKDLAKYAKDAAGQIRRDSALQVLSRWWIATPAAILLLSVVAFAASGTLRERVMFALFGMNEKHVVILPFENVGNDPANEPLTDGLMDSMTNRLSNLDESQSSLWVVPANFVRQKKVNSPAAAYSTFNATLAVQGSISRSPQDVRMNFNLVDTRTLRKLDSENLVDNNGDLSALEDQAITKIAKLMHVSATQDTLRNPAHTSNPSAYENYLKALSYVERYDKPGNLDLAIGELENAVTTDPGFALGYAEECEAYRLKFQLDQNPQWVDSASTKCKRAAEIDQRLPMVYVTLGRLHSSQGKDDLALQEFQQALALNRHDSNAMMGMASAFERMGRRTDAEKTYQTAASMRPEYWDGYNSLGVFYLRQRRYPEAVAQFTHVIELTPDNAAGYSNRGAAYSNMKEFAKAERDLQTSISHGPSYGAYVNLGFLYSDQKRYTEYAAMTEKALQLNDKDFRVWANLASAYRALGETDKARAASAKKLERLEAAVLVQPKDPIVQSALGISYAEQKLKDKAIPHIQAAVTLAPKNPQVLLNAGEAYEDLGDRRQALEMVQKSLKNGYTADRVKNNPAFSNLVQDPKFTAQAK